VRADTSRVTVDPSTDPLAHQRFVYEAWRNRNVGTLITSLTDPENRAWAARYLGKLGDPAAIGPLIRLLSAKDFHTRAAAARALGQLEAREAVPALLDSIDRGPEDVMRSWAIDALSKIGSHEAVPKLIEVLASPHEGLRRTAAAALGVIGDERAIPALEEAGPKESFFTRRLFRRAIRQIRAAAG
jgi:HEAT repeat protein